MPAVSARATPMTRRLAWSRTQPVWPSQRRTYAFETRISGVAEFLGGRRMDCESMVKVGPHARRILMPLACCGLFVYGVLVAFLGASMPDLRARLRSDPRARSPGVTNSRKLALKLVQKSRSDQ